MDIVLSTDVHLNKNERDLTEVIQKRYQSLRRTLEEFKDVKRITVRTSTERFEGGHVNTDTSFWVSQDESIKRPPVVDLITDYTNETVTAAAMSLNQSLLSLSVFPKQVSSLKSTTFMVVDFEKNAIVVKSHFSGGVVCPDTITFQMDP